MERFNEKITKGNIIDYNEIKAAKRNIDNNYIKVWFWDNGHHQLK